MLIEETEEIEETEGEADVSDGLEDRTPTETIKMVAGDITKTSMPIAIVVSILLGTAIFTWNVSAKVHSMEMDMATDYVKKDELEQVEGSVDKIEKILIKMAAELGVDIDD